jgi:CheY-like chemotaxis protein
MLEPAVAALPPEHEARSSALPQTSPFSVLAVDDNAVNRFMLEKQLLRQGCRVVTAADGTEALAILRQQRFEIVFMDVSMPGMDGMEVTRRLREAEGVARSVVIGVTAHAGPDVHQSCLAAGMDHVAVKPFKLADLTALLAGLPAPERV